MATQYGRPAIIEKHGRCGTCLFADLENAGTVECRRFPPAPYFEPTGRVSNIRPRVGAYYWCGEFTLDEDKAALEPSNG
ncbi:hypothetical protein VW35_01050 [Devosia soli]|uniref:Uncharacterized protein n=1 Tax=Devosia soli TaxID=361041 RepID=A0A0F5LGX5_9HYPH|nr:hypothetical protein [Devosia soli]KKB80827.1 hypothetical protein VW35_01050 [Devosia soli]